MSLLSSCTDLGSCVQNYFIQRDIRAMEDIPVTAVQASGIICTVPLHMTCTVTVHAAAFNSLFSSFHPVSADEKYPPFHVLTALTREAKNAWENLTIWFGNLGRASDLTLPDQHDGHDLNVRTQTTRKN